MKNKKAMVVIAAAASIAAITTGCNTSVPFDPSKEEMMFKYGAVVYEEPEDIPEYDPSNEVMTEDYGVLPVTDEEQQYDPSNELTTEYYGVPAMGHEDKNR